MAVSKAKKFIFIIKLYFEALKSYDVIIALQRAYAQKGCNEFDSFWSVENHVANMAEIPFPFYQWVTILLCRA